MVFPYLVNRERQFVQTVLSGTVSGRDITLTVEAIYADPHWRAGFDIVWNFAAVSELIFEPDDVDPLIAVRRTMNHVGGAGRDIIVVKPILDEGMARLYAAMRKNERRRTHLCASEKTALEILARSRGAEST